MIVQLDDITPTNPTNARCCIPFILGPGAWCVCARQGSGRAAKDRRALCAARDERAGARRRYECIYIIHIYYVIILIAGCLAWRVRGKGFWRNEANSPESGQWRGISCGPAGSREIPRDPASTRDNAYPRARPHARCARRGRRSDLERVQHRHASSHDIGGVSCNERQSMHFGGRREQSVNKRQAVRRAQ